MVARATVDPARDGEAEPLSGSCDQRELLKAGRRRLMADQHHHRLRGHLERSDGLLVRRTAQVCVTNLHTHTHTQHHTYIIHTHTPLRSHAHNYTHTHTHTEKVVLH